MDGGADTTYANGSVALDVLRQRYMQFRNMLTVWLRRKIFAPISKINDFYEYIDKKKVLIVPDIEWNHMSLFDMGDYITTLKELATNSQDVNKLVSFQTLYRSLGLSYEDEVQKMRKEDIDQVIRTKEKEALAPRLFSIKQIAKAALNQSSTTNNTELSKYWLNIVKTVQKSEDDLSKGAKSRKEF